MSGPELRAGAGRLLHPAMFAVFPVLAFFSSNLGQLHPSELLRMSVVSLVFGGLVVGITGVLVRRKDRAAIAASSILLLTLSYGHIYTGLKQIGLPGETIVRHRFLVPAAVAAILAGLLLVGRVRDPAAWNRGLTLVGAVALAGPLFQIAAFYVPAGLRSAAAGDEAAACRLQPPGELRDVYLLVLDAYERDDVLLEMHGYDNSWFLDRLESLGFYVARGSLSNYRHTELSLASMLNSTYIEDFPARFGTTPNHQWEIIQRIEDSSLRRDLECLGYRTVAFESGLFWTEWTDADYYLRRGQAGLQDLRLLGRLSRTEVVFLETTFARAGIDGMRQDRGGTAPPALDAYAHTRDRIRFVWDQLPAVPQLPSPKLVFVHVLSPHPPFVFGPNGEAILEGEFETAPEGRDIFRLYADQVTYLNTRVLESVEAILSQSAVSPVIVIMGDHGWADRNPEDKLSILNAIYLPEGGAHEPYPTMTPVNTFRLVLDGYFGARDGLVPDVSYFSPEGDTFNFALVENTWSP